MHYILREQKTITNCECAIWQIVVVLSLTFNFNIGLSVYVVPLSDKIRKGPSRYLHWTYLDMWSLEQRCTNRIFKIPGYDRVLVILRSGPSPGIIFKNHALCIRFRSDIEPSILKQGI